MIYNSLLDNRCSGTNSISLSLAARQIAVAGSDLANTALPSCFDLVEEEKEGQGELEQY